MTCSRCQQPKKRRSLAGAPWLGWRVRICPDCRPAVEKAFSLPLDASLSVLDREAALPYEEVWSFRYCRA